MGFGNRLKEILKERGVTIKELSEMSGISINTLYSITKRDTQAPASDTIRKIADALGVDEADLLTLDDITQQVRSSLQDINDSEKRLRLKLSEISEMLNADALYELLSTAIKMLQDDDYRSMFYKKDKTEH